MARSLNAQNTILKRAMTLTDDAGSAGPVKVNRAYTGEGAGQVLARESLRGQGNPKTKSTKKRKAATLTRSEAVAYVKSQVPGISEALARAIVHKTVHP